MSSTTSHHRCPDVTVHLSPDDTGEELRKEVEDGLTATPRELSPKWLYDERGCELFDEITRLDEYYPTRAERAILELHADEIVLAAGADTLIELGSGTSDKTRLLIDAMVRAATPERLVAFDVAEPTLCDAVAKLSAEHPDGQVRGVVGDFNVHLESSRAGAAAWSSSSAARSATCTPSSGPSSCRRSPRRSSRATRCWSGPTWSRTVVVSSLPTTMPPA